MSEAAAIRDFMVRGTEREVSLVTRRLSLQVLRGVVQRTPVDTGRARGNWQAALGEPIGVEVERLDRQGNSTIAAGSTVIAAQRAFQPIVIENNVPYISRLNDGWSSQAPAMYVESVLTSLSLGTERE